MLYYFFEKIYLCWKKDFSGKFSATYFSEILLLQIQFNLLFRKKDKKKLPTN